MSKKTRKEKILAEYRKRLKIFSMVPATEAEPNKKDYQQSINQESPVDKTRNRFFLQDLRKSLIVISLIITLEIALYFVRMNR